MQNNLKNRGGARGYFLIQTSRKHNGSCRDSGANPKCNGNSPSSTPANAFFSVDNSENHSWIAITRWEIKE